MSKIINGIQTYNHPCFIYRITTPQLIVKETATTLTGKNTDIIDTGDTSFLSGLTTLNQPGTYMVTYNLTFGVNSIGYREAYIKYSGHSTFKYGHQISSPPIAAYAALNGSDFIKCASGEKISIVVYHDALSSINVPESTNSYKAAEISIRKLF